MRGKLLKRGAGALDDYEILEALLMAFIPRRDVKPIAKVLEKQVGSLPAILAAPPEALVKAEGVGETVAAYLEAIAELNSRARRERREQSRVMFLDRKNQLILDEIMGRGTVGHAPVYPREIARRSRQVQCSRLILVHNHPSGDPKPSRADTDITREIFDVLQPFDISVHDHLIVGTSGVVSVMSAGLI